MERNKDEQTTNPPGQTILDLDFGALNPKTESVPLVLINFEETGAENRSAGSVAKFGILQTPLLQRLPSGVFNIIDGRRRLEAAANLSDVTQVECMVTDYQGEVVLAMAGISLNFGRSMNPLSEARYFEKCLIGGLGVDQIAAAMPDGTRITKAIIRSRLKLLTVPPEILAALEAGTIKATTALAISRMPQDQQAQTVVILDEVGRVTHSHLRDIRMARREHDVAKLPASLFEQPGVPPESERRATALSNVTRAIEAALRIPSVRKEDLRVLITQARRTTT